jgi:hypothetical protein
MKDLLDYSFRPNATFNMSWHPAAILPVTGTVTIHAIIIFLKSDQSTDSFDRTRPVNTTEPTLQCVVETGIFNKEAPKTVIALANSITNPL